MTRLVLAAVLYLLAAGVSAGPLEELLEQTRADLDRERSELAEREARFLAEREAQASLLAEAREQLASTRADSDRLRATLDANAARLDAQQAAVAEQAGDVAELQDVFRRLAGEIAVIIAESPVSASARERVHLARELADRDALPDSAALEQLWDLTLSHLVAARRIDTSGAPVITADGSEQVQQVTRIGPFTAWSEAGFLRYLPESGRFVAPARQPGVQPASIMREFVASGQAVTAGMVDPTRGALVSLLGQRASLAERIRQGGPVGYVIMALGAAGLGIALWRFGQLRRLRRHMQAAEAGASEQGPMAALLQVAREHPGVDAETLGLQLDEAIIAQTPRIQQGVGFIALLAGIAPLLGLLGTVTGIIETFQAITLHGTGDPRLMSGGISRALITTVMGLLVAIPMFLLHSLLSERSAGLLARLDERAAGLVADRAAREMPGA